MPVNGSGWCLSFSSCLFTAFKTHIELHLGGVVGVLVLLLLSLLLFHAVDHSVDWNILATPSHLKTTKTDGPTTTTTTTSR